MKTVGTSSDDKTCLNCHMHELSKLKELLGEEYDTDTVDHMTFLYNINMVKMLMVLDKKNMFHQIVVHLMSRIDSKIIFHYELYSHFGLPNQMESQNLFVRKELKIIQQ